MADLKQAYRALDPASPLATPDLYVPRPGDPMGLLAAEFELRTTPLKVLVGGQRGVGKTTELSRLAAALETANISVLQTNVDWSAERGGFLRLAESKRNVFIDGLEKSETEYAADWIASLSKLNNSLVVVVPISLLLAPESSATLAEWDRIISLPAISLRTREGEPCPDGIAILKSVIERRVGTEVFAPEALASLIEASAGIHRELLSLGQQACLRAAMAGYEQVREANARAAIEDKRQELSFHLTPQDIEYLAHLRDVQRITADPRVLPLINRNLIVSYHSDYAWFDVHPLVKPLLPAQPARKAAS